jgi:hypothetical protein
MDHVLRPPSESAFPAADALTSFPRCIDVLEVAVRDVLIHFWEEPFRRKAHEIVQSLSKGCDRCGFKESSGLLKSLEALLALSVEDIHQIRKSVGERILDVIALLKEQALKTQPLVED